MKINTTGAVLLAAVTLITFSVTAGKPKPPPSVWPSSTLFTFTYNVGTATNYHVYAVAESVGAIAQPTNTVILLNSYVLDLGPVFGTGTVACPPYVNSTTAGELRFANADDVGGSGNASELRMHPCGIINTCFTNAYPVTEVIGQSGRGTSGAWIQVYLNSDCDEDDPCVAQTYPVLYSGSAIPNPWNFDISTYIWNVEP